MTELARISRKFIIFAPSFSPNSGGIVVLHRLCDLLNKKGHQASLYPSFKISIIHKENWLKTVLSVVYAAFKFKFVRPFKTNPDLYTPIFGGKYSEISDQHVVVYSEGVIGNPLNAKCVVRWLLHQPGYNFGLTCFGNSELIISYGESFAQGFNLPLCRLSKNRLYLPLENLGYYNSKGALPDRERTGTAYCIRKGRGKPLVHDTTQSILIDDLPHEKIAEIFKRVKIFISYDSKTAYSVFAAMCGADSVVVPDPGVDVDAWEPEVSNRYGISYGFENMEWARNTRPLILEKIQKDIDQIDARINAFIDEVNEYFPPSREALINFRQ